MCAIIRVAVIFSVRRVVLVLLYLDNLKKNVYLELGTKDVVILRY